MKYLLAAILALALACDATPMPTEHYVTVAGEGYTVAPVDAGVDADAAQVMP